MISEDEAYYPVSHYLDGEEGWVSKGMLEDALFLVRWEDKTIFKAKLLFWVSGKREEPDLENDLYKLGFEAVALFDGVRHLNFMPTEEERFAGYDNYPSLRVWMQALFLLYQEEGRLAYIKEEGRYHSDSGPLFQIQAEGEDQDNTD